MSKYKNSRFRYKVERWAGRELLKAKWGLDFRRLFIKRKKDNLQLKRTKEKWWTDLEKNKYSFYHFNFILFFVIHYPRNSKMS